MWGRSKWKSCNEEGEKWLEGRFQVLSAITKTKGKVINKLAVSPHNLLESVLLSTPTWQSCWEEF